MSDRAYRDCGYLQDDDDRRSQGRGRGRSRSRSRSRSPQRWRDDHDYYGPPLPPRRQFDNRDRDRDRYLGNRSRSPPMRRPRSRSPSFSRDRREPPFDRRRTSGSDRSLSPPRRDDPHLMGPPRVPSRLSSSSTEPSDRRDGSPTYAPARSGGSREREREGDRYSPVQGSSSWSADARDRDKSGFAEIRRPTEDAVVPAQGKAREVDSVQMADEPKSAEETVLSLLTLFSTHSTLLSERANLKADLSSLHPSLVSIRTPGLTQEISTLSSRLSSLTPQIHKHISLLLREVSDSIGEAAREEIGALQDECGEVEALAREVEGRRARHGEEVEREMERLKVELEGERRRRREGEKEREEMWREMERMRGVVEELERNEKEKETKKKVSPAPDPEEMDQALRDLITTHVRSLLPSAPPTTHDHTHPNSRHASPKPDHRPSHSRSRSASSSSSPSVTPEPLLFIDSQPCYDPTDAHRLVLGALATFAEKWSAKVDGVQKGLEGVGAVLGL